MAPRDCPPTGARSGPVAGDGAAGRATQSALPVPADAPSGSATRCGVHGRDPMARPPGRWHALTREGVRLFFPLAAGYALLVPLVWVTAFGFRLPFARAIPVTQWHAYEMVFGVFAAALAGFLTSAVPEWTDTPPRRGRALAGLALLWVPGRVVGLLGIDALVVPAAVTDLAFLGLLVAYIAAPMRARRNTRHLSLVAWTVVLAGASLACRAGWLMADWALSARSLYVAVGAFAVLFSLALGRVNAVVVNLALDPSGANTHYRPHPGRQNLAAAMVALHLAAVTLAPESAVGAWLALAAAAAFFDRLAEWFVGRAVLRAEVLALATANGFAGVAFAVIGASGLDASLSLHAGVHLLTVGSLGLAVVAIFSIAGLRHTGHALVLPWQARIALLLIVTAALVRALPDIAGWSDPHGVRYVIAAIAWTAAFAVWLHGYWPMLCEPVRGNGEAGHC